MKWKSKTVNSEGKQLKQYTQWCGMINRAGGKHSKSYSNVSVSENFKDYDFYLEWASHQKGWLLEESGKLWNLDKDIVGDGTIYSEHTCVFVPPRINYLFCYKQGNNDYPRGVSLENNKNKYQAKGFNSSGSASHIGYYYSVEEAHKAYLDSRLNLMSILIKKYGSNLDDRVISEMLDSCTYGYWL